MSADRRQDIMGVLVALFGMAMCVVFYARGDLTVSFLVIWLAVVAFGAYLVSPMATRSAITDGASLAERFGFSRAGRRETDPVAVPTDSGIPLIVERPPEGKQIASGGELVDIDPNASPYAPKTDRDRALLAESVARRMREINEAAARLAPNVTEAANLQPLQPELAQRPPEFRPEPDAAPAPKPKRVRKPKPKADTAEGEEFGAEQVDASDVPPKHEARDYVPLGLMAMPEPGQGDKRVGQYFVLGEFAVSGSHPDLVAPVPAKLVPQVVKLASTILDPIRRLAGRPVTVLSGYRDKRLNAAVGGSPTSQHMYAQAADITCEGVQLMFESMLGGSLSVPCGQVILYPSKRFVHVALPGWTYRAPTYQVHEPSLGLRYRAVHSVRELRDLIGGKPLP